MNNKYLLIAMVASSFSGMNLIANPEGTIETPNIPTKTFKGVADKQIRNYCRENNTLLCEKLSKLTTMTDKIDSEKLNNLLHEIVEEMKTGNILVEKKLEQIVDNVEDFAGQIVDNTKNLADKIEQTFNEEIEKISEKLTE
jgi:hypothetical protein